MPIQITSNLIPRAGRDYFLLEDIYLRGGMRVVETQEARDAIPEESRKAMMLVGVLADGKYWSLDEDLVTWSEFKSGSGGGDTQQRQKRSYFVESIQPQSYADFNMKLGNTIMVLKNSVSAPCLLEVYTTNARNDENPYRFKAAEGHLLDDGSAMQEDGTIVRTRRFNFWSNLEEEADGNIFFRILNTSDEEIAVTLDLLFVVIES